MRKIKGGYSLGQLLEKKNPQQEKYYLLTRNADESIARELKPGKDQLMAIDEVLKQPDFLQMKVQDKALLWKFRYVLKERPNALVKFLQSARLDDDKEQSEALQLLKDWAHIDLEDALPLLSIKFAANKVFRREIESDATLAKVYNEIRAKSIKSLEN